VVLRDYCHSPNLLQTMPREFQAFLKLFRSFRPTPEPQPQASMTEAKEANAVAKKTPEQQAAEHYGLPIGRKVRVTLLGAANPELVGVLEIDDRLLLLPDPEKDRNLTLRIGSCVFELREIESCRVV
jgi:hypothetical protein